MSNKASWIVKIYQSQWILPSQAHVLYILSHGFLALFNQICVFICLHKKTYHKNTVANSIKHYWLKEVKYNNAPKYDKKLDKGAINAYMLCIFSKSSFKIWFIIIIYVFWNFNFIIFLVFHTWIKLLQVT
jgi:hypothetical protein